MKNLIWKVVVRLLGKPPVEEKPVECHFCGVVLLSQNERDMRCCDECDFCQVLKYYPVPLD